MGKFYGLRFQHRPVSIPTLKPREINYFTSFSKPTVPK
jgi:hypothetical protein